MWAGAFEAEKLRRGGWVGEGAAQRVEQLAQGTLPDTYLQGLALCQWPGRGQVSPFCCSAAIYLCNAFARGSDSGWGLEEAERLKVLKVQMSLYAGILPLMKEEDDDQ
jgi:hypothetical protein